MNASPEKGFKQSRLLSITKAVPKPRAILTREQVIEIFEFRPSSVFHRSSSNVALKYGVSEKTIRDIWNGRTWHSETQHMDTLRPARTVLPPGRPLGRKDSAPRRRNANHSQMLSELIDSANDSVVSTIEPSNDLNDPFHDDWPFWARAGDPQVDLFPFIPLSSEHQPFDILASLDHRSQRQDNKPPPTNLHHNFKPDPDPALHTAAAATPWWGRI